MHPRERTPPVDVAGNPMERREEDELIDHDHPRIQSALLREISPGGARQLARVRALPDHPPGVRGEDTKRDAHRRGLARAVRAEEAEDLARRHLEREPV